MKEQINKNKTCIVPKNKQVKVCCQEKQFTCLYINVLSTRQGFRRPGSELLSGPFSSHGSLSDRLLSLYLRGVELSDLSIVNDNNR